MTLQEAVAIVFWPGKEREGWVRDLGLTGSLLGLVVGSVYFSSRLWLFFAAGMIGIFLGGGIALVLLLCGYGASSSLNATPQDSRRGSEPPSDHP
jgi:hypothetical protein